MYRTYMRRAVAQVQITPIDAQIIEISWHVSLSKHLDHDDMDKLTRQLAYIVSNDTARFVEMSLPEIYQLRRIVDPTVKVGNVSGWHVIMKLYRAMLEIDPVSYDWESMLRPREEVDARNASQSADDPQN